MSKRVRPYGSADDAEAAARARRHCDDADPVSDIGTVHEAVAQATGAVRALLELGTDFTGLDDARAVIAGLERMGQDLPHLCEQLARILVVRREERRIASGEGQDPDFWVGEAIEALASAGQAADMMTAALAQARRTSGELRPAR
ncbi:MAG TPA: hypothetical protein VGG16_16220 [Streptosporangiaceae bacterium]|jgi:hypothetical protein